MVKLGIGNRLYPDADEALTRESGRTLPRDGWQKVNDDNLPVEARATAGSINIKSVPSSHLPAASFSPNTAHFGLAAASLMIVEKPLPI